MIQKKSADTPKNTTNKRRGIATEIPPWHGQQ